MSWPAVFRAHSSACMMSSKKMFGDLPPSSTVLGMMFSAAQRMMCEPTGVEPVNAILAIRVLVASAVTIGSGGSAGSEGPIVQIGSSVASKLGQWLHVSPRRMKTFVGCGAAAGIAAVKDDLEMGGM